MDCRTTFANGHVAHSSLKGQVDVPEFSDGTWKQIVAPKVPLLDAPNGARDREALLGETVLELESRDGMSFVCLQRDGYVGYISSNYLASPPWIATHYVSAIRTYAKETASFKSYEPVYDLAFGSRVSVTDTSGAWSEVVFRTTNAPDRGIPYFLPTQHLTAFDTRHTDAAAVAELFLGTPYLWGGNSSFGIDCSGLVQAALHACGTPCPGDSDLQEAAFPEASGPYRRGDLLFWKGHVAMVTDPETIIHVNAHHMAVALEPIAGAIARIQSQGDGPVTSHKRPNYGAKS